MNNENFKTTKKIPAKLAFAAILGFGILIIASNFLVQFPIGSFLTLGALSYPFTYLLSDVLSEKYKREDVLRLVRFGILLAVVPSFFLATPQIALASIIAFFCSQQFDVLAFYFLKSRFSRAWWLRTFGSTALSQALDTALFFGIAFMGVMSPSEIALLALGDYSIKVLFAVLNTPLFYLFAIQTKYRILGLGGFKSLDIKSKK